MEYGIGVLFFVYCFQLTGGFRYESLRYSKNALNGLNLDQHVRLRRAATDNRYSKPPPSNPVQLSFEALNRTFNLQLFENSRHIFSDQFYIQFPDGCKTLSQVLVHSQETGGKKVTILKGHLADKGRNSLVYGYAADGVFFGRIKDLADGSSFYVDSVESFSRNNFNNSNDSIATDHDVHSVIYDELSLPINGRPFHHSSEGENSANSSEEASEDESDSSVVTGCAYHGATRDHMEQMQMHTQTTKWDKNKFSSDAIRDSIQDRIRRSSSSNQSAPNTVYKKNTCLLSITSDHLFTAQYNDVSVVTAEVANFVAELNSIFEQLEFADGTKGYGFAIAKIIIEDESSLQRDDYKYKDPYIGVEKLLDLVSTEDHSEYCLAYLFTARDFMKGVLGLAWVAADSASGGICEGYKMHQNGQMKSLNTGVITTVNYGVPVAARVSHLTFTHEVGHNWGSPHDFPSTCKPGGQQGNYIMFSSATAADKPNNNRFSECSVANMSHILVQRRDECFKEAGRAICGNMVLDEDEECDCGYEANCLNSGDQCCWPADTESSSQGQPCTLKAGLRCSPTQGPCCTTECQLVPQSQQKLCQEATECIEASYCDGNSYLCEPVKKPDLTDCNAASQVCVDGVCSGSVCLKHGMEDCLCEDEEHLCDLCCQQTNKPNTCQSSSHFEQFAFNKKMRHVGSPCNDFNGYCDAFNRCMAIDANGPLSRLRDAIFNPDIYKGIFEWAKAHWWLTVIICVSSSILFILFVKIFSVHTPSSNPHLPKNRQIRETVSTLPRTIRRSTSSAMAAGGAGASRRRHARQQYQSGRPYSVSGPAPANGPLDLEPPRNNPRGPPSRDSSKNGAPPKRRSKNRRSSNGSRQPPAHRDPNYPPPFSGRSPPPLHSHYSQPHPPDLNHANEFELREVLAPPPYSA